MCHYFKPVVKPRAASMSSNVTASTSEAPAAKFTITIPSTSTTPVVLPFTSPAPKLSPLSAGAAPPHAVTPSQPVLTTYPRRALG